MAAIFQTTFSNGFSWTKMYEFRLNISLKFVPRGPINNIPTLVQVMAWRGPGDNQWWLDYRRICHCLNELMILGSSYGCSTTGHQVFSLSILILYVQPDRLGNQTNVSSQAISQQSVQLILIHSLWSRRHMVISIWVNIQNSMFTPWIRL